MLLLRDNLIASWRQLVHLRGAPSLAVLCLQGNPVARLANYRGFVVNSTLGLRLLDDFLVADEELDQVATMPALVVDKMTALLSDDGEAGKQKRLLAELLRVNAARRLPLPELLQKRYFNAIGDDTQSHKHVEVLAVFCSPASPSPSEPSPSCCS